MKQKWFPTDNLQYYGKSTFYHVLIPIRETADGQPLLKEGK